MKIAGIILAGGLSTRMAQDKATLLLGKKTLLARNVSLLSALNLNDVFVSGDYQGFQCIQDLHTSLGPIGGLHACVEMLFNDFDALFVIPVDMPLLSVVNNLYSDRFLFSCVFNTSVKYFLSWTVIGNIIGNIAFS